MAYTPITKERIYDDESNIGKTITTIHKYNEETGEVETITTEKTVSYGRSPYVQVDKNYLVKLLELLSPVEMKTLTLLFSEMSWKSNLVYITQEEVAKRMDLGVRTVARAFSNFIRYDLIRNKTHGQWMINPNLAIACKFERINKLRDDYDNLPAPEKDKSVENERSQEQ